MTPTTTDWIIAGTAIAAFVLALVTMIIGIRQLRLTARQIRDTAEREAADSEERTRPYVSADVQPSLTGAPAFDILITNYGKSTARNIRGGLVGRIIDGLSGDDRIAPSLAKVFENGFDLAPGARRRMIWHVPGDEKATPAGDQGAPTAGELALQFDWSPDDGRDTRTYESRLRYELDDFAMIAPQPNRGKEATGKQSDSNVALRDTAFALRAVAEHLAELRR